jgi:hypothetical protein
MATGTLPRQAFDRDGWRHDNPFQSGQRIARKAGGLLRRMTGRPRAAVSDHWMTVAAMGCISAAFFQLNTFWGLLATGALIAVFEYKVSE